MIDKVAVRLEPGDEVAARFIGSVKPEREPTVITVEFEAPPALTAMV